MGVENRRSTESTTGTTFHDSMVTVRLSEPLALQIITTTGTNERERHSLGDLRAAASVDPEDALPSPTIKMVDPNGNELDDVPSARRGSGSSSGSSSGHGDPEGSVDWEELVRTEEQQPRDQESDDSTALLLARLEQENNLLAIDPKAVVQKQPAPDETRKPSRPLSMQQLKKLVNAPIPSALRYSVIPPPPMTDLEFYAALVQDYTRTAQCLPTLLSKKIRSGVPPPLRGVVWQSMSGARDHALEDEFDRLSGETSPYEGIIGKDLGRSFPGVEMFRDPEGSGQQMLGRVLKSFSLYDTKIGYCQGLGFLVGPLLMHMGDKQAFCVLVRLMERYDLRSCFLPDLSGLHVRIHIFRLLLRQHLPTLAAHLEHLQIEPAYVSQWFLSFFAVTCPLPMLFRIYDVIFAEGASETIMRVALSLMKRNEARLMACTEFEDAMQLLLSRGLWDCYHYNDDEFVQDFVAMTGIVTQESLRALQASYRESQAIETAVPADIGSAASRFLGRLWATKSISAPNLSPGSPAPPTSDMQRSPSKQSLASTWNLSDADSLLSSTTGVSRDSSNTEASSIRTPSTALKPSKDKGLHSQIEDLLLALSELQRDHSTLVTQLQREREEREEDRTAVTMLLSALRHRSPASSISEQAGSDESCEPDAYADTLAAVEDRFATPLSPVVTQPSGHDGKDVVEAVRSKSELRHSLHRSKTALLTSFAQTQDLKRQVADQEQQISNLHDEVREKQTIIRNAHADRQRLEKVVHDLRTERKSTATSETNESAKPAAGLRELKLGRQHSSGTTTRPLLGFGKRSSSLVFGGSPSMPAELSPPLSTWEQSPILESAGGVEHDHLVAELVQAKTSEAVAKQEAEEAKAKLEALKRLLGSNQEPSSTAASSPLDSPSLAGHKTSPSQNVASSVAAGLAGGFWSGWGKRAASSSAA